MVVKEGDQQGAVAEEILVRVQMEAHGLAAEHHRRRRVQDTLRRRGCRSRLYTLLLLPLLRLPHLTSAISFIILISFLINFHLNSLLPLIFGPSDNYLGFYCLMVFAFVDKIGHRKRVM